MRELPRCRWTCRPRWPTGTADFLAMGMDRAYCGAPAEATRREKDESTFDTLTDLLVELIDELMAHG